MPVYRIYVSKRPSYAVESQGLCQDLKHSLQISGLEEIQILNRYDVEDLTREEFDSVRWVVFAEPQLDLTYDHLPQYDGDTQVFAVESLPGQYDQRADSCAQCISLVTQKERPLVRTAKVYAIKGRLSGEEFEKIKHYLINPVESREASLDTVETLKKAYEIPVAVETVTGFISWDRSGLEKFLSQYGLAMDLDDVAFCQSYFRDTEHRDPTMTEIRMIDTYWSDHCRHTTFSTQIQNLELDADYMKETFGNYLDAKEFLYPGKNRPTTLMDLATMGAKILKKQGYLKDLDESEEINACSVKIKVDVDGQIQDWLLMFKNETHNHPTEIEPFGGAATCLGGAIRDPLSGRSYVYQAMRVTGSGDPTVPLSDALPGKLPQKKLTTTAAAGYSSYGNQIGLATGHVAEIYHPGYVAKRLEIGAVIGAAPASHVRRERPQAGDVILLLGGKTGRDGCGGATGSSKSHTLQSLENCGAEVQKGNAPEERKLQRLFRKGQVTRMIKRCNDFGAGGVSVAIGELADGLDINLDVVPKKYEGLDGTELAISESQERMAVVVAKEDVAAFIEEASKENLLCTPVAVVTEAPRLVMHWMGNRIVDISREFLNSNGAAKYTDVLVPAPAQLKTDRFEGADLESRAKAVLSDLSLCSQKGLVERFDSTIGAGTVLMPFGGNTQLTPSQAMAAKIPLEKGETNTCSLMAYGFDPYLSEQSPYHGAACAVVESMAKLVAAGGSHERSWLTFQEYFERTKGDPKRWGKPAAALLGAFAAQTGLKVGAIGGKDSMSGTFEQIDVPPTLVSFAVSVAKTQDIITTDFKGPEHQVVVACPKYDQNGLPVYDSVCSVFCQVETLRKEGKLLSAWALGMGGLLEAVCKMGFGNRIGFAFDASVKMEDLTCPCYGGFVLELAEGVDCPMSFTVVGVTQAQPEISGFGQRVSHKELLEIWENRLERVFPYHTAQGQDVKVESYTFSAVSRSFPAVKIAQPQVVIPVFPGTNCEYDTARAFERAGAKAEMLVILNQTASDIEQSVTAMAQAISKSQMIAIPGGFSGGDEPDGSGKFILSFFRNPKVREGVMELLRNRDGLMLGICNGFQALIKLGLVPYGEIVDTNQDCPTLTYNTIGRHQSMLTTTRIASNKSPWLMFTQPGELYRVAISHGEGRFVAPEGMISRLAANGQIATQYVDEAGAPTMNLRCNPNSSFGAIEGITSPDGRILGKMGHSERIGAGLYQNVTGEKDQHLFQGAVAYFK